MKKFFLAILLCITILTCMCSCSVYVSLGDKTPGTDTDGNISVGDTKGYNQIDADLFDFSTVLYTKTDLTRGYDYLKEESERLCYDLISKSVFYISQEKKGNSYDILPVTVESATLCESQLHLIITAYTLDHPEIFWIENEFSYYINSSGDTSLQLKSALSSEEITQGAELMRNELDSMMSGLQGNLSQYDRELYIHDTLLNNCVYAGEVLKGADDFSYYTSYGAIVNSKAVCEGYSKAMQLMLSMVGVESSCVSGRGVDELHMWNIVSIGDKWYHLDATWNDTEEENVNYDNFNITTEQILLDHSISPLYDELTEAQICGDDNSPAQKFNLFVPECTDYDMSYYMNNSVTVTGFDDENIMGISEAITKAARNNEESIHLYIDPDFLSLEEAENNLFYSGDYAIFTCIDKANDMLTDTRVSDDQVSTTNSPVHNIITVYFEYEAVE